MNHSKVAQSHTEGLSEALNDLKELHKHLNEHNRMQHDHHHKEVDQTKFRHKLQTK